MNPGQKVLLIDDLLATGGEIHLIFCPSNIDTDIYCLKT